MATNAVKNKESVNIVTKYPGIGSLQENRGAEGTSDPGKDPRSIIQTSKHSRFQTLEEILYSLDTENPSTKTKIPASRKLSGDTKVDNLRMDKETCVKTTGVQTGIQTGLQTTQDNATVGDSASVHSYFISPNDLKPYLTPGEQDKGEEAAQVRKPRLRDWDLDTFLPADLDEAVSSEDLQTRRRLLDYQLQRRIEQYYLEDLDLDSLNAEDIAADYNLRAIESWNLNTPAKPDYPQSVESEEECSICLEVLVVQKRWCCDFPVCTNCMDQYLEIKVSHGVVKISCINGDCLSYIHRDEIHDRLSTEMKEKFYRFLVNANQDPHIKTCPKCSHVYNEGELGSDDRRKFGQLVICPECKLNWCFHCHAPWHFATKCKDFLKGDKLVKRWANEQHFGVNNAQKCPKCKIFIERKGGCDHMMCTRCNTGFCYRCGDRYRDLKIFGNHLSRYSIVGCKYNYMPNHPAARRFCRGSIFGLELLGGVVLLGLGVVAAGLLLGTSVIILPAFGGYKYHKRRKIRRRMKRQEELFKMRTKNALVEMQRERAVLERYAERFNLQQTDSDIGPVHVGIQTERSQKVDVTVHSPSTVNPAANTEQTVDSKICMNISDERGQVTVTTAEITHNASKGDRSEAEVVLHVRTTYTNINKEMENEGRGLVLDNEREVADGSVPGLVDGSLCEGLKESKSESNIKRSEDITQTPRVNLSASDNSTLSLPHTKHSRAASLPVKSDLMENKDNVKSSFGKQHFRRSERSRKLSKTKDFKSSETYSQTTAVDQTDLDHGEALPKYSDEKASEDQDENGENEGLYQSGCFLKLFSRKFSTLQNQLGKEREKNALTRSLSEPIDYTNCPDLVSCIIASELKNRENKEEYKDQDREPAQQAEGVVAKETCSTSF